MFIYRRVDAPDPGNPGEGDVRQGTLFGPDDEYTGTLDLPDEADVRDGVSYDNETMTGTLEAGHEFYGLPRTGQTTSYRDGDDGYFQTGLPGAETPALVQLIGDGPDETTRFTEETIEGDDVVIDHVTGLMWMKENGPALDGLDWDDAIDACLALDHAGHQDWRMPNWLELLSIMDFTDTSPAGEFKGGINPEDKSNYHWSSTTPSNVTTLAWVAGMGSLDFLAESKSEDWLAVIPVRGGIYNNNTHGDLEE